MPNREERVQLIVEINAKESGEYQKLIQKQAGLAKDIKKATVGSADYNKAIAASAALTKDFASIDINKLSGNQLIERSRQLERMKKLLPQNSSALRAMEAEQKKLNDALATARSRTKGVAQGLEDASKKGNGFIGTLTRMAPLLVAAFSVRAIGGFIKNIFNLGTELDIIEAKYRTVFAEAADIVDGFAQQNAESLGLTTDQYRDNAASIGDLLVPMGFQRDETAKLSTDVLNLSGALSEWSKGKRKSTEVSNILSKALLGEREGLKGLGISISEADIKQRLREKGMEKLTGTLLQQAKAMATYELIFEKSTDAQDAFANNTNKNIRLQNELKATINTQVSGIAKKLVPIFNKALVVGLSFVRVILNMIIGLGQIPKFIKENRVELAALVIGLIAFNAQSIAASANALRQAAVTKGVTIATKAQAIAQRLLNGVLRANPIGLVVTALAALTIGLVQAYKRSESFRRSVFGLGGVIKEVYTIFKESFAAFGAGISQLADGDIVGGLKSIGTALVKSNPIGIAFTQGDRLKKAFQDGYDKVQFDDGLVKTEVKATVSTAGADTYSLLDGINDRLNGGAGDGSKDTTETAKKEKKVAEIDPDAEINAAIAAQKAKFEKLNLLRELDRQERTISEEEFDLQELEGKRAHYAALLGIYDQFGRDGTNAAIEVRTEQAALANEAEELRIAQQIEREDLEAEAAQERLRERFLTAMIAEEEFHIQKLELDILQAQERLDLLASLGLAETDAFRATELLKLESQKELSDARIEVAKEEQEKRDELEKLKRKGLNDTLDAAIGFLKEEGKESRAAFKLQQALTAAKILVGLPKEIQGYYEAYSNIPFIGPVLATVQSGLAVGRAVSAVSKINSQKFFGGGKVMRQVLSGQRISQPANIPSTPEGDNVLAYVRTGEVILNEQQQTAVGGPSVFARIGVPGFADGGLTTANTTPVSQPGLSISTPAQDDSLVEEFRNLKAILTQQPRVQKSYILFQDIEDAKSEIDEIRGKAEL